MNSGIILLAIFFDIFGLIPLLGLVMNPMFSFILWMAYGSKKKNLVNKQFVAAPIGMIIESVPILNFVPTNLANAILTIYVFK